ncbi:hypothetical protein LC613_38955 [Nostoc sphaeroides CHAB 2801]|uniref:hypothetical protein n=1 Tax=Nostoc sphaeroides TaxID=446679 RepID=UPI001E3D1C27|nr:hypothetical protein [Nostoc sphaeroides]MCC5633447.1 hypothetical protein [Nostoc sphaeroides CHAB 2801]
MTRFSITKNQKTPEQWSALAFKATTENNIQWNIALGLIVAAVAASATSPLTGADTTFYFRRFYRQRIGTK